jgi:hypothetical protein
MDRKLRDTKPINYAELDPKEENSHDGVISIFTNCPAQNAVFMLHDNYLFEIKELKQNENPETYKNCRNLGLYIYERMIANDGEVKPRSDFTYMNGVARANFILVDCFAFLKEIDFDYIANQFTIIFPRLITGQRLITTGHIRSIFLGLTNNFNPKNSQSGHIKAFEQLNGQTGTANQRAHKMEYAQSAITLIELCYEQRVRIEFFDQDVGYGVRSNFNLNKVYSKIEPLLTGINLPTESKITKLLESEVNAKGKESLVDHGTGVFGLPYYLNSSRVDGLKVAGTEPNCTLEVSEASVFLYDSEHKLISDTFQVQVSFVKVRKDYTLRLNDQMTWDYEYLVKS